MKMTTKKKQFERENIEIIAAIYKLKSWKWVKESEEYEKNEGVKWWCIRCSWT